MYTLTVLIGSAWDLGMFALGEFCCANGVGSLKSSWDTFLDVSDDPQPIV